ncbi:MAG: alkyl sulfatase dimerization domain-containing protein [Ilumatobacteraceae bacterium]
MSSNQQPPATTHDGILQGTEPSRTIVPGVHLIPTQGNSLAIETDAGVVVIDAGPGGNQTARMIAALRTYTDAPVRAIVYSHGHIGYNTGVPQWRAHAAERGEAPPELIAHERCLARYHRYRETLPLQYLLNTLQFAGASPDAVNEGLQFVDPTVTVDGELRLDDPQRPIVVRAAPSETDDAVVVWLPEQRILYGGAATPGSTLPNIGTPLRSLRLTARWADTLEQMAALGAEQLVQEFGPVVEGADAVRAQLETTARALRWVRAAVVEKMNEGWTDVEIIHALDYPAELFDQPYMRETYGARDYIVRDLYREENGWWTSRNATDLHPAHPDDAAAAVLSAIDPQRVLDRARELAAAGDLQLALHVVDLVAQAPGDDPILLEARTAKAEWCDLLARQTKPYVSRAVYKGSARLLRNGLRRWSEVPDGIHALPVE